MNTVNKVFNVYKGDSMVGTCSIEVTDFYAEHGYPEYDTKSDDYYIMSVIRDNYPKASSWIMADSPYAAK